MTFSYLRAGLFGCVAAGWAASTALAQAAANYTSVEAVSGRPLQLSYHASAHKSNCTPAALPTVRVTEAPKAGILAVRGAVLTTNKISGCPALKTPAQVVFYQASENWCARPPSCQDIEDALQRGATSG